MPPIKLHRQICAYIDVLGGAKLFNGADRRRAAEFLSCLYTFEQRMNGWSSHFLKKRQARALVKTFSDNIFIAFPLRSSSKMNDVQVVALFLQELVDQIFNLTILSGFPMRGAVTVESLMFTENFLFGPALVKAVELEKSALFPRVLLCDSVLRYIKPDSIYRSLVLRDADGRAFLDYLGGKPFQPTLKMHREYVQNGLKENASRVHERQKYEWLTRYHNFHALTAGVPEEQISNDLISEFELYGNHTSSVRVLRE